ncbi:MAG: hypothetical protein H7306_14070 [Bacteriovorax sp.]|nr:hypothetical protein [Rhizobacter sp.]
MLLIRLLIGERRRWRFDAAMWRAVRAVQRLWRSTRRWYERRRAGTNAAKVTKEVIRRARDGSRDGSDSQARAKGEWDGNVYRPKSFRKPPRDKQH